MASRLATVVDGGRKMKFGAQKSADAGNFFRIVAAIAGDRS